MTRICRYSGLLSTVEHHLNSIDTISPAKTRKHNLNWQTMGKLSQCYSWFACPEVSGIEKIKYGPHEIVIRNLQCHRMWGLMKWVRYTINNIF